MYFDTGSDSSSRPSSYSERAATVTIGLVMDAIRKIALGVIGAPAALSRKPTACTDATRPLRATTTTAPGIRPRSTSTRSTCPMRSSRSDDSPTCSGFAVGRSLAPA